VTADLKEHKEDQPSVHLRQQTSTLGKSSSENTRGEGKKSSLPSILRPLIGGEAWD
jgi:hypothetical protein